MREEKPNSPSQKKKSTQTKSWFWPAIYSGIAIVFVGMIWGYNAFINNDTPGLKTVRWMVNRVLANWLSRRMHQRKSQISIC